MRPQSLPLFLFLLSAVLLLSAQAEERATGNWPRFRGVNGSGVSEQQVATAWQEGEWKWRVELPGTGHSSPVVWGDKIFVTSGDEESATRFALCLDRASGKELWRRKFPAASHRKHALNSFASATPAVDAKHVYIAWATPEEFRVIALDHQGRDAWDKNLGTFQAGHGFGVSLIVHGDLVIVPGDQQGESFVAALDGKSGETVWRVARETLVTYSTPCVVEQNGRDLLIFTTWKRGIEAIDPATGETAWQAKVFAEETTETSIGSPVVAGDLVLGCAGWLTRKNRVVAVRIADGEAQKVWEVTRGAPLSTTPLVVGDLAFLWTDDGIVSCIDLQTGAQHWMKRVGGNYYGSPVAMGGHVYCMSTGGECVVLKASKDYELVGKSPVGEPSHATPAVAGGTLLLRTFSHLIAIE